eukprot:CAMPEP_0196813716 /NCGR_PEP_ID=MMETSP1362-20130617/38563_1 /TAXON_ID=163516 /ORGANISM="Leptocylindrus danicus, Strain CCMP1856" /LENGTH=481 /DNA_ID=CAMNT_0042190059 /DNA_START=225 /DNA_END=1671 /DNA_ORIENTATION=+
MTAYTTAALKLTQATTSSARQRNHHFRHCQPLSMSTNSNNSNQYDLSKPSFDLLSLRTRRGDALLQYTSTNQSEPLRINLYALFALSFAAFPSISEAVVGEPMDFIPSIGSVGAAVASLGLFFRECSRRSRQIDRLEKELNAEFLGISVPNGVGGMLPLMKLKDLRGQRRVIALSGNATQLRDALLFARVVRRRLTQAAVAIVAVPTDGSTRKDWGFDENDLGKTWLAEANNVPEWLEYFENLVEDRGDDFAWFGLKYTGRSFGSGRTDSPRLLELLGSFLQPIAVLDEDDKDAPAAGNSEHGNILSSQRTFYNALTTGNKDKMDSICSPEVSNEVTEVVSAGGRLDSWDFCLADGARPSGMAISGCDSVLISDDTAYSTCIEFPDVEGFDTATLLAVQKWSREKETNGWKLTCHQTIPWSPDTKAGGTLDAIAEVVSLSFDKQIERLLDGSLSTRELQYVTRIPKTLKVDEFICNADEHI